MNGKRPRSYPTWTTADEVEFIRTLGQHHHFKTYSDDRRLQLLLKYRGSILSRTEWNHLDKDVVKAVVDSEIMPLAAVLEDRDA